MERQGHLKNPVIRSRCRFTAVPVAVKRQTLQHDEVRRKTCSVGQLVSIKTTYLLYSNASTCSVILCSACCGTIRLNLSKFDQFFGRSKIDTFTMLQHDKARDKLNDHGIFHHAVFP